MFTRSILKSLSHHKMPICTDSHFFPLLSFIEPKAKLNIHYVLGIVDTVVNETHTAHIHGAYNHYKY